MREAGTQREAWNFNFNKTAFSMQIMVGPTYKNHG